METYINKQNSRFNMRKLLILMLLPFLMLSSVSALDLIVNQDNNLADYRTTSKGNIQIENLVGSVNNNLTIASSNNSYFYDFELELVSMNTDFYFVIQNVFVNETLIFLYRGDLSQDPTFYVQNVTLNEIGRYYFKFEPEFVDEPGKIYLGAESNSFIGTIEIVEDMPQDFNEIVKTIVSTFDDVVDINLSIWKLLFFLLLIAIVISAFTILGWFVMEILKFAERFNQKRRRGER